IRAVYRGLFDEVLVPPGVVFDLASERTKLGGGEDHDGSLACDCETGSRCIMRYCGAKRWSPRRTLRRHPLRCMTSLIDLRDPLQARDWVWQGLCAAAIQPVTPAEASRTLAWCIELASEQQPLPPVGIIADVGRLLDRDGYDRLSHGSGSTHGVKH